MTFSIVLYKKMSCKCQFHEGLVKDGSCFLVYLTKIYQLCMSQSVKLENARNDGHGKNLL